MSWCLPIEGSIALGVPRKALIVHRWCLSQRSVKVRVFKIKKEFKKEFKCKIQDKGLGLGFIIIII